ncbi:unnamed protein product [Prunus armeniaca]
MPLQKIWGGSFAGGESSAVETQNREKGGEASGIRNKKRKEKKRKAHVRLGVLFPHNCCYFLITVAVPNFNCIIKTSLPIFTNEFFVLFRFLLLFCSNLLELGVQNPPFGRASVNAVDYVQVRLWRLSLLDVELDTLCGTNEEGTRFSNSFDVANESTMLSASEETDPKYLRDMVLSLIAAGKDTTASTLTWFIYMVCKHLHIQEKISREVREATDLKDKSSIDELSDNLTEETL